MKQEEFSDWNGHLSDKYRLEKKDTEGNAFKLTETTWMNFGWGERHDPSTGKMIMVHHPNEVWFRKTFSTSEPWQRVRISRSEVDSDHPPPLYDGPVPINPYKIKDLNKMAEKYIPEPQRSFYATLVPEKKDKKTGSTDDGN